MIRDEVKRDYKPRKVGVVELLLVVLSPLVLVVVAS